VKLEITNLKIACALIGNDLSRWLTLQSPQKQMTNIAIDVIEKLQKFADRYFSRAIAYLIVATWLGANFRALQWLLESITYTSWFNRILIFSVVFAFMGWVLIKTRFSAISATISPTITLNLQPLLLIITTALGAIALQWTIELPQINAVLFLLGSYGLCGLFLELSVWQKRLAIAFTVSIVLPFSLQFTGGLGFAARVLTSHAVEQILTFWHIAAISSHDIIVLENGIASVDLPCSGLRSLWTGTLFLLGATWLEGRKLGFRWLLVYAGCLGLLTLANIGRVLVLTITTFVLKQPLLADLIHTPLGLIGFMGACGLAWAGLRLVPRFNSEAVKVAKLPIALNHQQPRFPLISLLAGIMIFALIPRPSLIGVNMAAVPIQMPLNIQTQAQILSPKESEFFSDNAIATKQRFQFGNLAGSMLLVSSNSWRSHHAPELCITGNGLKVDSMISLRLSSDLKSDRLNQSKSDFPVRWLTLEDGKMSAMYWFQSSSQITDDILARMWSEISHGDRDWMMVSVLFDRPQSADNPEVKAFANSIRSALFSST